jgi:hypothetical protein
VDNGGHSRPVVRTPEGPRGGRGPVRAGLRGPAREAVAAGTRAVRRREAGGPRQGGRSAAGRRGRSGYSRPMTKWEYATVPLLVHATKQILDTWGEDGWELVQVVPGPNPEQLVAYLKREKQA